MNKFNDFYVYRYIRLDKNIPFYVGKGRNKRAFNVGNHNELCNRIFKKYEVLIEIIVENLSEEEAFSKELEFISLYKSMGYCSANFTNGGQGLSGLEFSSDHRRKLSDAAKGRTRSAEHQKKLNDSKRGVKRAPFKEETRLKISKISKSWVRSEEYRNKMRHLRLGKKLKPLSEETKLKISESLKRINK